MYRCTHFSRAHILVSCEDATGSRRCTEHPARLGLGPDTEAPALLIFWFVCVHLFFFVVVLLLNGVTKNSFLSCGIKPLDVFALVLQVMSSAAVQVLEGGCLMANK